MKISREYFEQRARLAQLEYNILDAIPENSSLVEAIIALQHVQTRLLAHLTEGDDEDTEESDDS